jgi:uncharacterized protein
VCEPHWAVCCDQRGEGLNLVAMESERARETITELARENPDRLAREGQRVNELFLSPDHPVPGEKIRIEKLRKIFGQIYDRSPEGFEELLGIPGVGPKSLQALSLISELLYGSPPSFRDPARFSFAHGGKDGHPYPVDRVVYDRTIEVLSCALEKARLGDREKIGALKRLKHFSEIADCRLKI